MYRIAICDDDKIMLEMLSGKIKAVFDKCDKHCELYLYDMGTDLLEDINSKFDAVFLDIDMPVVSGIDVADQIKKNDSDINIIFVTSHEDLVFKAIHYSPFRFIRKSCIDEELEESLRSLMEKAVNETMVFWVSNSGVAVKVKIKDIVYLESNKHYVYVNYMVDSHMETCRVRAKLASYEEILCNYSFVRIHAAYIVNIRYINSIKRNTVILDNGYDLSVARGKVEELRNKYSKYIEDEFICK